MPQGPILMKSMPPQKITTNLKKKTMKEGILMKTMPSTITITMRKIIEEGTINKWKKPMKILILRKKKRDIDCLHLGTLLKDSSEEHQLTQEEFLLATEAIYLHKEWDLHHRDSVAQWWCIQEKDLHISPINIKAMIMMPQRDQVFT